ncbi:HEPN domain-containing protein [Microbacterium jejuense]|uniref:ApeA N-terminal domain 1-containing protein n=1 Tax=Microbacterium jejuense TaxID=1263637 RepID=UPI0031EDA041
MDDPRLDQRREWSGEWWLPDAPEQTFGGVLTYEPGKELSLGLIGGWRYAEPAEPLPGVRVGRGDLLRWPIIHGRTGETPLTLIDAWVSEARGGNDDRPDALSIGAMTLLVDLHLHAEDEPVFVSGWVTTENLNEWTRRSGFREERGRGLEAETLEPLEAVTGELRVRLHTLSSNQSWTRKRDGFHIEHWEQAAMEFRSDTPRPMDDFFEPMRSVSDLMTLSTLEPCADITVRLYTPPVPDRYAEGHVFATALHKVDVYQYRTRTPEPEAGATVWIDFILSREDQPFDDLIPRWFELRDTFKAALDMVLGLTYLTGGYLQTRVVSAVSAAEAFHRALKVPPPLSDAEHSSLRAALFAAVPDDHRQWLHDRTRYNQPTLRERLVDLARRPGPFMNDLVPNPDAWAKAAAQSRDGVAHFGAAGHSRYDELHAIVMITAAVVTMNLLGELGISQERMRRALRENRDLRWTCELARQHFGETPLAETGH